MNQRRTTRRKIELGKHSHSAIRDEIRSLKAEQDALEDRQKEISNLRVEIERQLEEKTQVRRELELPREGSRRPVGLRSIEEKIRRLATEIAELERERVSLDQEEVDLQDQILNMSERIREAEARLQGGTKEHPPEKDRPGRNTGAGEPQGSGQNDNNVLPPQGPLPPSPQPPPSRRLSRRHVLLGIGAVIAVVVVWNVLSGRNGASVPVGKVEVLLEGPDSAEVYLDDSTAPAGLAPLVLAGLTVGHHDLRVVAPGYDELNMTTQVQAGETVRITARPTYRPRVRGIVVNVKRRDVTIGLGARDGLTEESRLYAERSAAPITHNGQVLGYDTTELEIVELGDDTLTARPADRGSTMPQVGDKVFRR